jgi:hypothetical protein
MWTPISGLTSRTSQFSGDVSVFYNKPDDPSLRARSTRTGLYSLVGTASVSRTFVWAPGGMALGNFAPVA